MDGDYEDLYKWIEEHTITRPKRNINRDFSDAVPLVEILKHHFPKLVDVHNYTAKNSHAQKVINWETLNNKVLKRLKMNLSRKKIELLAKGEPGEIEKLLIEIKKKVENKSQSSELYDIYYLEESKSPRKSGNGLKKKVIPGEIFDKMQADLAEKDEAVKILKSKVDHLENLLSIKEERIKDLSLQLQTIVNSSSRPDSSQSQGSSSKFFGFFQTNSSNEAVKNEQEM